MFKRIKSPHKGPSKPRMTTYRVSLSRIDLLIFMEEIGRIGAIILETYHDITAVIYSIVSSLSFILPLEMNAGSIASHPPFEGHPFRCRIGSV
jgi:hypothetical protein